MQCPGHECQAKYVKKKKKQKMMVWSYSVFNLSSKRADCKPLHVDFSHFI